MSFYCCETSRKGCNNQWEFCKTIRATLLHVEVRRKSGHRICMTSSGPLIVNIHVNLCPPGTGPVSACHNQFEFSHEFYARRNGNPLGCCWGEGKQAALCLKLSYWRRTFRRHRFEISGHIGLLLNLSFH